MVKRFLVIIVANKVVYEELLESTTVSNLHAKAFRRARKVQEFMSLGYDPKEWHNASGTFARQNVQFNYGKHGNSILANIKLLIEKE